LSLARTIESKKADAVEYNNVFDRVGLLGNGPPSDAELSFP
jgi:hypothetical protein